MAKHAHTTSPASVTQATSRRTLFGAAALLALATPARAVDHSPDAEMIRLAAAFHEAHSASHAPDDNSWEAHLDRRNKISDGIVGIAATTEAGKLAKASVALTLMEEGCCITSDYEAMALSALRDLVGSAAR